MSTQEALACGVDGGDDDDGDGFGAFVEAEPPAAGGSGPAGTRQLADLAAAAEVGAVSERAPPVPAACDDAAAAADGFGHDFGNDLADDFAEAQANAGSTGEGSQQPQAATPQKQDAATADDDDFGDFAEASGGERQQSLPPACGGGSVQAQPSGVQEHSLVSSAAALATDAQSAPAGGGGSEDGSDAGDDGFGDFSEAQPAPSAQLLPSQTLPALPPHTPSAQAECSGGAAFSSDLSGLKSRAYLVAACRLLANDDDAAPLDDIRNENTAIPGLDKLLSGEAGAPAWVPPSPLLLRAAGLAGGRAPSSWDAPLWEGSPAQRRIHTLLHVARDENVASSAAGILRQHSSSRVEQGSAGAPTHGFVARAQSAPNALLSQAAAVTAHGSSVLAPAAAGSVALSGVAATAAHEAGDVWGLEAALAAPQVSGARAASPAPPVHDLGYGLSATTRGNAALAALLQRAPSLSFMLQRSIVPKAL